MLPRVVGSVPFTSGTLVADDDYVPLAFRAYKEVLPSPYIWQGMGTDRLVELTIDRESKVLRGVKLVLCGFKRSGTIGLAYGTAEIIAGLPVIGTTGFKRTESLMHPLHIHESDFDVILSGHDCFVVFEPDAAPSRCYRVDRVGVFEAVSEIVAVGFFGLVNREISNIDRLVPTR
jgi:hypothetical protein